MSDTDDSAPELRSSIIKYGNRSVNWAPFVNSIIGMQGIVIPPGGVRVRYVSTPVRLGDGTPVGERCTVLVYIYSQDEQEEVKDGKAGKDSGTIWFQFADIHPPKDDDESESDEKDQDEPNFLFDPPSRETKQQHLNTALRRLILRPHVLHVPAAFERFPTTRAEWRFFEESLVKDRRKNRCKFEPPRRTHQLEYHEDSECIIVIPKRAAKKK